MKKDRMMIPYFLVIILLSSSILTGTVFAQTEKDAEPRRHTNGRLPRI